MPHFAISIVVGALVAALLTLTFLKVGQKSEEQILADRDLIKSCGDEGLIALYEQAATDAEREDILQFVKEKLATEGKPAEAATAEEELEPEGDFDLAPAGHFSPPMEQGLASPEQPEPALQEQAELASGEEVSAAEEDLSYYTQADLSGMSEPGQFEAEEPASVAEADLTEQTPLPGEDAQAEAVPLTSPVDLSEPQTEAEPQSAPAPTPVMAAEPAPPTPPAPMEEVEQMAASAAPPELEPPPQAAEAAPVPEAPPLTLEEYINDHFARLNAESKEDHPVWPEPGWDEYQAEAEQPLVEPAFAQAEEQAAVAELPDNETVPPPSLEPETTGLASIFAGSAMQGMVGEAEAVAAAEAEIGATAESAAAEPQIATETPMEDTIGGTRILPMDEIDWSQLEADLEAKRQETARVMAQNTHIQEVFEKVKGVESRILNEQQESEPPSTS